MTYRFDSATFAITCREAVVGAVAHVLVEGVAAAGETFRLVDDGRAHTALVTFGRQHCSLLEAP